MPPGEVFAFGPFQLDVDGRRLTRDGEPLTLAPRHFDLLCLLVAHAGDILSKNALIDAGWPDVAVTDNSLEQAISSLRRTLTPPSGQSYIETQARRGYRFAADVRPVVRRETDEGLEALLAPHRAWIEGRAALETLEAAAILGARSVFESVVAQTPAQAAAHVGLANACALQFEMTRADAEPDREAIETALHHAREACRLDTRYGEAWATLGFVLDRVGQHADALAAARRAVTLEPDNWRHQLRLSYASWGEERLRAARRTLALMPGLALAHWLAATVLIARQALAAAEAELVAGIASDAAAVGQPTTFSGVALHWLLGLIALAHGDDRRAFEEFDRELRPESRGHLYARECAANTWYAIGAASARQGRTEAAARAFREALRRVPSHPFARAAADGIESGSGLRQTRHDSAAVEADITRAVAAAARHDVTACDAAARAVECTLGSAPPGSAGWLLPVEPMLHVSAHPEPWAGALARLRHRAG